MVAEPIDLWGDLHPEAPDWLQSQPPAIPATEYQTGVQDVLTDEVTRKRPNPYREWPSYELKDQHEYRGLQVLEYHLRMASDSEIDWTFSLYVAKTHLEFIEREMQRRRNILIDSGKRVPFGMERQLRIDFAAVKDRVSIESFVNQVAVPGPKDRHTTNRDVLCCFLPGHTQDHSPSFTIYKDQQSCWCYGCGRGGDVIELARHWFREDNGAFAAKRLCEFMQVEVPKVADKHPKVVRGEPMPFADLGVYGVDPDGNVVSFDPELFKRKAPRRWR